MTPAPTLWNRIAFVVILATAALAPFACTPAIAQHEARHGGYDTTGIIPEGNWGEGHGQQHDWYKKLTSPSPLFLGYSCCAAMQKHGDHGTLGDCRPTRARQLDDGSWVAMLEGYEVPIPPDVVLPSEVNQDPIYAHICAALSTKTIYCFIPAGAGI